MAVITNVAGNATSTTSATETAADKESAFIKAANDALGVKSGLTRLGNASNVAIDHKVILEYRVGTGAVMTIEAMLPQNFNFDLRANWSQKDAMGLKDFASGGMQSAGRAINRAGASLAGSSRASQIASKVVQGAGSTIKWAGRGIAAASDVTGLSNTTFQFMTAHYWQGASPISCTIPFEFMAEKDPEKEVLTPLKELYKLAAPYEVEGIIIPPGPSVLGTATGLGVQINIYLGRILAFKNVIVESVSSEIDTRPSKGTNTNNKGTILHAKVDVSFTTFYTATRDDIDTMFDRTYTGPSTTSGS